MPYRDILTPLMQRLVRLVGTNAARDLVRDVPGLVVDAEGNVIDYDHAEPRATVTRLVDLYEAASRMSTLTGAAPVSSRDPESTEPAPPSQQDAVHPFRILLVDDHSLVLKGLASLIEPQPDMQIVGQAGTVREAISLARSLMPDLILMDFTLPDGTGDEATRVIRATLPETKIIFLTVHDDDERLVAAIAAGATGYLLKSMRSADLLSRLRDVAHGDVVLSPSIGRRILEKLTHQQSVPQSAPSNSADLTERELEIMGQIVQGFTNRQIANHLSLSVRTVEYHRANLMAKLGLHTRADLVQYATTHRLLNP
jgi:DNA-binding NarL/FixJ family response regulator